MCYRKTFSFIVLIEKIIIYVYTYIVVFSIAIITFLLLFDINFINIFGRIRRISRNGRKSVFIIVYIVLVSSFVFSLILSAPDASSHTSDGEKKLSLNIDC